MTVVQSLLKVTTIHLGFAAIALTTLLGGAMLQGDAPKPKPTATPPLILLYDQMPDPGQRAALESLQVQQYLQVNQDAPSYKTGVLNISELTRAIELGTKSKLFPWMMLDAETPFFDDLAKGPNSPECKRATETLIAAIQSLKARFPGVKWSIYGIPNLPYWVDGKGWASADEAKKREMLTTVAAVSQPLVAELDWISPSIYQFYDPRMVVPGSPQSIRGTPASVTADGREWRAAQVGLGKLLAGSKPVIPYVFPYWAPGGIAPACRLIDPRELMEDQIVPAIQAGAAGIALWSGMEYRIEQVTRAGQDPTLNTTESNFGVTDWRRAFVADYLGRNAPSDWSNPFVRGTLTRKTSQTLIDTLANIRAWEQTKTLPKAREP